MKILGSLQSFLRVDERSEDLYVALDDFFCFFFQGNDLITTEVHS